MYQNSLKLKTGLSIVVFILCMLNVHARMENPVTAGGAGVDQVRFGTSYVTALEDFQRLWGSPEASDSASILYTDKTFQGIKFDRIELDFQYVDTLSYFNQARFYKFCPSKGQAIREMKILAERLGKVYSVSYDEEEGGTPFYKGGCAPVGLDDLFTVFVAPQERRWTCQLRYGAFSYAHPGA